MKRLIVGIMMTLAFVCEGRAQEGLHIAGLFDGRYKRSDNAIEVTIKGKELKPYRLTYFRSLTIKESPADFERMERLVKEDAREAVDKETGHIGERLYYGFYCLPPRKGVMRYLFYRNSSLRKVEPCEATLIYMEGNVSLEELKEMFK
ncbi:MAG: hypothetical protein IJ456_11640 [Bacteroides sp.]|nr:hypothetical protein [Bacteroides sp.]